MGNTSSNPNNNKTNDIKNNIVRIVSKNQGTVGTDSPSTVDLSNSQDLGGMTMTEDLKSSEIDRIDKVINLRDGDMVFMTPTGSTTNQSSTSVPAPKIILQLVKKSEYRNNMTGGSKNKYVGGGLSELDRIKNALLKNAVGGKRKESYFLNGDQDDTVDTSIVSEDSDISDDSDSLDDIDTIHGDDINTSHGDDIDTYRQGNTTNISEISSEISSDNDSDSKLSGDSDDDNDDDSDDDSDDDDDSDNDSDMDRIIGGTKYFSSTDESTYSQRYAHGKVMAFNSTSSEDSYVVNPHMSDRFNRK